MKRKTGDVASTVVIATASIFSVNLTQQNIPSISTAILTSSHKSINKMSRGQVSWEKMERMFENCRNKRIQRKLLEAQTVQIQRKKCFNETYQSGWRGGITFFEKVCKVYNKAYLFFTKTMTQAFLIMGQKMNQGVPRNSPPSHY